MRYLSAANYEEMPPNDDKKLEEGEIRSSEEVTIDVETLGSDQIRAKQDKINTSPSGLSSLDFFA